MDLFDIIAEKREQLLHVAAKYGAHDLRVFGSLARGDADEHSDVNILVRLDSSGLRGHAVL